MYEDAGEGVQEPATVTSLPASLLDRVKTFIFPIILIVFLGKDVVILCTFSQYANVLVGRCKS